MIEGQRVLETNQQVGNLQSIFTPFAAVVISPPRKRCQAVHPEHIQVQDSSSISVSAHQLQWLCPTWKSRRFSLHIPCNYNTFRLSYFCSQSRRISDTYRPQESRSTLNTIDGVLPTAFLPSYARMVLFPNTTINITTCCRPEKCRF